MFMQHARNADEDSSFDLSKDHADKGIASEYDTPMRYACAITRFFLTVDGCAGLEPTGARRGDVVTVFFGSGVPCLLRRYGWQWLFVGFCYVHGFMDGQSVSTWRRCARGRLLRDSAVENASFVVCL